MFMGQYNHSLDAKGRVIVPAKLREELGDTFVVTATIDGVSAQAKVTLGSDAQANINNNANADETFRKAKLGYDR